MLPWLIPILASVAGGLASTGLASALAPDAPKAQKPTPQGLSSVAAVNQQQAAQDPSQDDILQQYLATMRAQRMGG